MSIHKQKNFRMLAAALLAMGATMSAAQADDDRNEKYGAKYGGENHGKPLQPAQTNAKFQKECKRPINPNLPA